MFRAWLPPGTTARGGKRRTFAAGKADGAKKLARVYPTDEAAQTAANAAHAKAGRELMSLSLTLALGRPDLAAEQTAKVSGYKPSIDVILWKVAEVDHTLSNAGFITSLKPERQPET
ncbi:MAG: phage late control family protein [Sphingomonas sp.]|jgi:phage protein D|nr:phage late control family protein [Sphingomonas sp.]